MKEIKDNPNKWRDKLCFGIGRINIVKMTTLPKAIYRFSAILIKLPMAFFTESEQKKLYNLYRNTKDCEQPKQLRKKNRAAGIRLPDRRLYYQATVIKAVWYCHKIRNRDQ